ncbi:MULTISPECIES: PAS domain-containing sensor histidine kinase [Ignavibacterium]|jgi:PAS domain S-box-containing protein|uniref:PAS domain-containing sensor histidine kinase n=1 Tax=Ignavibacterium TaxID=795750 RepID=UPI0025C3FC97|nr:MULTISPECIES: PAS domain-containing sensor histidine kinase [Ignavibacterium]MBI5661899.1 PAS domain S-box protein [Ignavibacterium album]
MNDLNFNFALFDSFPEMFFLVNSHGKIVRMNSVALTTLKQHTDETEIFFDYIELCDRNNSEIIFSDALKYSCSKELETRLFINRNFINVKITIVPIKDSNENESFALISVRDISEEKRKEAELIRFLNVAENSVNPIEITDLNGKIIYVNRAFEVASGYSKEELLGKNPRVFGSGKLPSSFWDKMWATISSGKVWVGEVENRKKNGEPFYTQLLISPIIEKDGKVSGYFAIHRDLTEKRTLERQLIHTQKMESIGTLAAGIAHEVGNPLASISALVQVAQRSSKDPFVNEKLSLVKSQITRISKIIRDLVDFSRPSNYELELTDVNKVITEAVEITRVGTKAKDITFETNLSDSIPMLPLIADQIQQVFLNILLNAVDAISEKKEKHNEKISITSEADPDWLTITFVDTGPGIKDENLTKIFEPFFTTKKEGKGTGLGLWVSYGIVKSFQGDIKVKSKLNEGTTFIIKLPIHN